MPYKAQKRKANSERQKETWSESALRGGEVKGGHLRRRVQYACMCG